LPKSFRELRVWQAAVDLTLEIYELTAEFPKHEIYGLSSQMRRASVSIASNVAEGSARGTRRDFRQFVLMARGSNFELQTQLLIALRLGYASKDKLERAEMAALEVGRMLHGLSTYLKRKQSTPGPPET
jgi:four helix bundle protein